MSRDTTAENILKQLLEKSVDITEITKSREALKTAGGPELIELHKELNHKTRRSVELAVEDVVKGDNKKMPLVLAGPDQLRKCPGAGSTSLTASAPELQAKVESLKKCMTDFIESNKKQMEVTGRQKSKIVFKPNPYCLQKRVICQHI